MKINQVINSAITEAHTSMPQVTRMFFYNVPSGQEEYAAAHGIKQTKSGKWALKQYDKSGRTFNANKSAADNMFGKGLMWEPRTAVDETDAKVTAIDPIKKTITTDNGNGVTTTMPSNLATKDASGALTVDPAKTAATSSGELDPNAPKVGDVVKATEDMQPGQQEQPDSTSLITGDEETCRLKELAGLR